jgi:hypothetical protein
VSLFVVVIGGGVCRRRRCGLVRSVGFKKLFHHSHLLFSEIISHVTVTSTSKKKQGSGGYKTGVSLFQAPFKRHQVFSMER